MEGREPYRFDFERIYICVAYLKYAELSVIWLISSRNLHNSLKKVTHIALVLSTQESLFWFLGRNAKIFGIGRSIATIAFRFVDLLELSISL